MSADRKLLENMIRRALSGEGSHVGVKDAFAGLDWKLTGVQPDGAPHSIFQLLNHMTYWNQWVVRWLAGQNPPTPKRARSGWPGTGAPQTAKEWREAVRQFDQGLREMMRASRASDLLVKQGTNTRLEMLQMIASHNSYHLGQVVLLRQRLGAWSPPSGGLAW
jgi:uncharacterized damage-inducible protein DinB